MKNATVNFLLKNCNTNIFGKLLEALNFVYVCITLSLFGMKVMCPHIKLFMSFKIQYSVLSLNVTLKFVKAHYLHPLYPLNFSL